ncbi:MAG: ARPP-1 family domain-containing protein [Gaiellaceae bacterium]
MIDTSIQLGDPVEHRGIVVAPLFPRRTPEAIYVTIEQALPLGFRVEEVSDSGAVPELVVRNPTDRDVLLYDGEELLGAKQNRILNVSVLVAAGAKTLIPVSCVEEGRWQRRSPAFASAPHASHPELRRRKVEQLAAEPLARGTAQGVVWDAVREKAARLDAASPTGAQADVFRSRADELRELEGAFAAAPGQCGAVLALGDTLCLDYVSRPDAFVALWQKLRAGYLLDAIERLDGKAAKPEALGSFVGAVAAGATLRQPSAGRGEDLRLRGAGVVGSGLALGEELIQLSAFTSA